MTPLTALVTGASRGLGAALTEALSRRGWRLVVDGRDPGRLAATVAALPRPDLVTAVPGDVTDPAHRAALAAAVGDDRLDLLVNNASELGPTPLPRLADLPPAALERVLAVNTVAPLALAQAVLPALERARGVVLDVSSDAAVEAYEGWGGYGASKAALDRLTAVLAVEQPTLRVYAVDPGDMATDMHRAADPDATGLPEPAAVVPALLRLVDEALPAGRYRVASQQGPAASSRAVGGREVLLLPSGRYRAADVAVAAEAGR
jgi:NAD(P)-dependent dehydrogenase (short-subunit alcohol dehydrogenase family)